MQADGGRLSMGPQTECSSQVPKLQGPGILTLHKSLIVVMAKNHTLHMV